MILQLLKQLSIHFIVIVVGKNIQNTYLLRMAEFQNVNMEVNSTVSLHYLTQRKHNQQ